MRDQRELDRRKVAQGRLPTKPRREQLHRRGFAKRALIGIAGLGAIAGGIGIRRGYAASQLSSQMMGRAGRIISDKEQAEIQELPAEARTEIREYIHGICLDAHRFAEAVCEPSFRDRLAGCCTDDERQGEFHLAFSKHLATEAELNNRLRTIATDVGSRLDQNWALCCHGVAETWGVALRPYEGGFAGDQLAAWAEPLVRERLTAAIHETTTATLRPAIGTLMDSLGTSAVMLLPVMVEAPFAGVPVFVALAFRPVFEFFIGLFRSPQADVQQRVCGHLAVLSERLGTELEREVRRRIAELHSWQYGAMREVAHEQAWRSTGWL
jgi:hypothetical protein